jgi:hypothetical protein
MTTSWRTWGNLILTLCIVVMAVDMLWKNTTGAYFSPIVESSSSSSSSSSGAISVANKKNSNSINMNSNDIESLRSDGEAHFLRNGNSNNYPLSSTPPAGTQIPNEVGSRTNSDVGSNTHNVVSSLISNSLTQLGSTGTASSADNRNKMLEDLNNNNINHQADSGDQDVGGTNGVVSPKDGDVAGARDGADAGKSDEQKTKELEALIEEVFQKEVEIRKRDADKTAAASKTSKQSPGSGTTPLSSKDLKASFPLISSQFTPNSNDLDIGVISGQDKNDLVEDPRNPGTGTMIPKEKILSLERPVWADVRGYLGPPSVVSNEYTSRQNDRWQASLDMRGIPIPGHHWLRIDLGRPCYISRVVIDWEEGYSSDYAVHGRLEPIDCGTLVATPDTIVSTSISNSPASATSCLNPRDGWVKVMDTKEDRRIAIDTVTSHKHVIHGFNTYGRGTYEDKVGTLLMLDGTLRTGDLAGPFRVVKLLIRTPATKWGPSVWRWHLWGTDRI